MGYLRPTSGEASIAGFDCYRQSLAVHAATAYLPGEPRLFRPMRGRDVLRFFAQMRPDGNLERAVEVAERLKLDLSRRVALCSTGMRQKLAIATVLSTDARLLILDEPTSSLDPTARGEVLRLITEARTAGCTVLCSSHVLSEVEQVCDRVAVLKDGRLAHVQTMSQLRLRHRIAARLHGDLHEIPPAVSAADIRHEADGTLRIEIPGDLTPVLGWLAQLPLEEVRIEPLGLQAIYDQIHDPEHAEGGDADADGPVDDGADAPAKDLVLDRP